MPDRDDIPPCPPLSNPPVPPGYYRIRTADPGNSTHAEFLRRIDGKDHLFEIPEHLLRD